MKHPVAAMLNACIAVKPKLHNRQKEGTVLLYCEAININYLLKTLATHYVIAKTDADIMQITQPSNTSAMEYANGMSNKALRCNRVNDKYVLKGILIECLS